jgi:hypothetical protein
MVESSSTPAGTFHLRYSPSFVLKVLGLHRHLFADQVCLRTIRTKLGEYLKWKVPAGVEEDSTMAWG